MEPLAIHVISDSTGVFAEHLLSSVLMQFPKLHKIEALHVFETDPRRIRKIIRDLPTTRTVVLHAIVKASLKEIVAAECHRRNIPHFDLTGSLVQFIAEHSGIAPEDNRSLLHKVNADYFRRIEAMEFTAQHDDGRIESVDKADIVLVGVSRVGKTPAAIFLGSLGYKVANIALAPQMKIPEIISDLPAVALTCQPRALWTIRTRRFEKFQRALAAHGERPLDYYDLPAVTREVRWAEEEMRKRNIPIIDVTELTVEEIAARVKRELHFI